MTSATRSRWSSLLNRPRISSRSFGPRSPFRYMRIGYDEPAMATVALGGVTLELDDLGRGAPVLLLHGFPTTRRLWAGVAPALAEAGYGASSAAAGVSIGMADQARWMLRLLDHLGIESAAIVAHDVGSAAAQIM